MVGASAILRLASGRRISPYGSRVYTSFFSVPRPETGGLYKKNRGYQKNKKHVSGGGKGGHHSSQPTFGAPGLGPAATRRSESAEVEVKGVAQLRGIDFVELSCELSVTLDRHLEAPSYPVP